MSWKLATPEDDVYVSFDAPSLGITVVACELVENKLWRYCGVVVVLLCPKLHRQTAV